MTASKFHFLSVTFLRFPQVSGAILHSIASFGMYGVYEGVYNFMKWMRWV